VISIAVGFNTIDAMLWSFRWNSYWYSVTFWDMGPFIFPQWWSYFLFGIAPFALGWLSLGFIVKALLIAD